MEEELKELLKKYIKHSLCTTPKGIQSRVYLDSEEISNLKSELPQTKPLTNDEIREIGDECELKNNGILNWIDFVRAIEERHGIHVQKT